MPAFILMPALSPSMKQGSLVCWCKSVGDVVRAGDVVAEVDTDKATMEVESPHDGVLFRILVPAGAPSVPVLSPIAVLLFSEDSEGDASAFCSSVFVASPGGDPPTSSSSPVACSLPPALGLSVGVSPLARKIAANCGVDLSSLPPGSGPGGRIVKSDVLSACSSCSSGSCRSAYTDELPSRMRKVIADKLSSSKRNSPHFYLNISCCVDKALLIKAVLNQDDKDGKITLNDIIVKAVGVVLSKHTSLNVAWINDKIRRYSNCDVCVAVSVPDGIFTPVIKNVDQKTLFNISQEIREKAKLAKEGNLPPSDCTGGCLTISNLGMFGVSRFQAIINPPQGSILAVGASEKRPIVSNHGSIEIATMLDLCLSVDHRAIDGVPAAKFLQTLKSTIENLSSIL
jgi:pyruvate dehydrogenase E2 component (dihydrolipoamide acetyltransferase)